ncbi:hypothetical protein IGB42_01561 [Andreprevotia sp. IGB-42]|uniref:hypothetical protein n=1 Tax=Andreprevotia sp. IGB-42 TaxID=2497473 RepID=UPI00135A64D2|nr:hypothetical protein [Andreprevotia sp. IGB-42]KAF0813882.1 hypothetical protein IGB42_01561 [Andreprevotia sp. IGB-42]
MSTPKLPERWQRSDPAIRAVQVAFDVEDEVLQVVRRAAFEQNISNSDQIRHVLGLPVSGRPKRPRLTVTLSDDDYRILAGRYGLAETQRLEIKEQALAALIEFARKKKV